MTNIQTERRAEKRRRVRLEERLMEMEAIELDRDQSKAMQEIATNLGGDIQDFLPENSHQRLLWEEQMKRAKLKDSRYRTWRTTIFSRIIIILTFNSDV